MELYSWSWLFLAMYVFIMLGFGWLGSRRMRDAVMSAVLTAIVSRYSRPLPREHMLKLAG